MKFPIFPSGSFWTAEIWALVHQKNMNEANFSLSFALGPEFYLSLCVGAQVGFEPEWVDHRNERLDGVEGRAGNGRIGGHVTTAFREHSVDAKEKELNLNKNVWYARGHTIGWRNNLHKVVGLHQPRGGHLKLNSVDRTFEPNYQWTEARDNPKKFNFNQQSIY